MVFDLEKLIPKKRKELSPETRAEYAAHYAKTLQKYGYTRDQQNAEAFDKIADYFGRWYAGTAGECSFPKKGLFISGPKGTGKTTALRIFSGLFKINIVPIEDFTIAFTTGKEEAFWQVACEYSHKHLIIDDVCNEQTVKVYGNKIPLPEFFKIREDLWKTEGIYTFYTSNANGRDEITKLYGDTITSRFLGSCEFIRLAGRDRRIT